LRLFTRAPCTRITSWRLVAMRLLSIHDQRLPRSNQLRGSKLLRFARSR
jgi:hypothetical protein